jgi:hypothetical protein
MLAEIMQLDPKVREDLEKRFVLLGGPLDVSVAI